MSGWWDRFRERRAAERALPERRHRRFYLYRDVDATGVSGTGVVAEGVEFSNGWCGVTWLSQHTSVVFYPSIADVAVIHGHGGLTRVIWLDEDYRG